METINVGLLGFGTIGTGIVKTLLKQQSLLRSRVGVALELKKIADLDITTPREVEVDRALLTTDVNEVLNDPDIQIVIELIGGYEPAKSFILQAIRNGKHVVTANKALLAVHGKEIFEVASRHNVDIGFEGSVGGGIPIIRSLREGFVANNFIEIYGILNGTTNYILTEMTEKGESLDAVLQQAQRLGLAEANPTFDIEGIDPAHKIIILTYLAFGVHVGMNQILIEGISQIDARDIKFAGELGYKIKLLAIAKQTNHALEVRVHPTMLAADHLLAKVDGSFNAIYVVGDIVDSNMFYGRGAGMMPTASAVVGDIVDIARNILKKISNKVPLIYQSDESSPLTVKACDEFFSRYYLHFTVLDRPGVLSKISGVLAEHNISIASVMQKEIHPVDSVPVVMLTYKASEREMQQALVKIDKLDVVRDKTVLIRVL
jgi:homoserine dehydrogenase